MSKMKPKAKVDLVTAEDCEANGESWCAVEINALRKRNAALTAALAEIIGLAVDQREGLRLRAREVDTIIAAAHEALVQAQAELKHAVKDSTNPHFRSKYADLGAVWDAAKPALAKARGEP